MRPAGTPVSRHMVDGTIRGFLAEASLPLAGLLTAAFLTRRLGPASFGLFILVATLVNWIEGSIISSFSRTVFKFVAEAEDWRPLGTTIVQLYWVIGSGFMLVLWLLALPIARMFNEPVLVGYVGLFALDIPLFCLARAHQHILIGIGGFNQRALVIAGRSVARLILSVALVEIGLSIPGAILGSIGASLAELGISRCYVRPALFRRFAFPPREFLNYAGVLFLTGLSLTLFSKLDLFMLKLLDGTAVQAGIYGAAQNLSLPPSLFAVALSPLLLATLSRLLQGGNSPLAKHLGGDALRAVIGLLPFISVVAGAAAEIVNLI